MYPSASLGPYVLETFVLPNRLTSGGLPSSLYDTLVIVRRTGTCVRLDGEQRLLHPIFNQPNALRLLDLFPTVNHAWIFVLCMLLHSMDD